MNSCLYHCEVRHHRLKPRPHRFAMSLFMFYVDLDELETLIARFAVLSRNRWNLFSFWDRDHLQFGGRDIKENILRYLESQGVTLPGGRIMLLTHWRTLGYQFNPISVYFCFDAEGHPRAAVAEVGNTFREMKPYCLGPDRWTGQRFDAILPKYFYVSPFIPHDSSFDFKLAPPQDTLALTVNGNVEAAPAFWASLAGRREELTRWRLIWMAIRFPMITLQVIGRIHWEAFRLWLKGVPFFRKSDHQDLQRGYQHVPQR